MADSTFTYVTYIKTTADELWRALTNQQRILQWWFGVRCDCEWTPGASWSMTYPDGRTTDEGEILEAAAPRRIVIRWRNLGNPTFVAEGESRCTIELEPIAAAVKLTLTHTMLRDRSAFIAAVATAWPMCLSNLKSLLETGGPVLTSH